MYSVIPIPLLLEWELLLLASLFGQNVMHKRLHTSTKGRNKTLLRSSDALVRAVDGVSRPKVPNR